MDSDRSVTLFISYAHADEGLKLQLEKHLTPLRRNGVIERWSDHQIEAGQDWAHEIDRNLKTADIILLLVSPDLLFSEYCTGVELKEAMKRHHSNEAIVVPVILKSCNWDLMEFGKLQAVPREGKAVSTWPDKDEAFTDVTARIGELAQGLLERREKARDARQAAAARYKAEVEEALSDGDIAPLELKTLNDLRIELNMTPEVAETIRDNAYKPLREYQSKLAQYREDLAETIQREYPPSERTKIDLKQRQRKLGLKAEDAERLEAELLAAADIHHRAQLAAGETATQRARAESERQAHAEADGRVRAADEQQRQAAEEVKKLAAERALAALEAAELKARRQTEKSERRLAEEERQHQAATQQALPPAAPPWRAPAGADASHAAKLRDRPVSPAPGLAVAAPIGATATDRLKFAGIGAVVVAIASFLPTLVVDRVDAADFVLGAAMFGAIVGAVSTSYRWVNGFAVFMFLVAMVAES